MSIASRIQRIREHVQIHGPLQTDEQETLMRGSTKYSREEILDSLIDFYGTHHRWPKNSTEYNRDTMLPHFATVKSHFGSQGEAHKQAEEKMRGS